MQNEALAGMPDSNLKSAGHRAVRSIGASGPVAHPGSVGQMSTDMMNRSKVHPMRPVLPQHRQKDMSPGATMTSDLDQKIASVKKVWNDPSSPGIDGSGDNRPAKSPTLRNQYPTSVGPIGVNYGMQSDSMSSQINNMKQMHSGRQPQQVPHQYQRSLSGHYMGSNSNSPPISMMNHISSPPPQLEAMRQHLSQQQHHQQQQQQQHFVQQQGGTGGSSHTPSISNPAHHLYNMATIANMYPPAFNQHMAPGASVQLQAFAQQLAFHQSQHPIRSGVQSAAPHHAAAYASSQMSDYRNMGQAAVGHQPHQQQPQPHQPQQQQQQQQQANMMKAQYMQQPNYHFWNR